MQNPANPEPSPARLALAWLRDLVISVLIAALVILFIYQPVQVEGTSMMPALENQERIFINKFAYRMGIEKISRGDLVVFWFPGEPGKSYIKRVVGLPGDRVSIDRGTVFVNGSRLPEDYVPARYRDSLSAPETRVPDGHYYVLGDHRSSSSDSRSWGPIGRDSIYGRAVFVYWPLARIGPVR
ncbi:MAG: signal peptidase I [Bryobacterales bacterium]|nr:signal peptidase I [Bryobacterales bacterium]